MISSIPSWNAMVIKHGVGAIATMARRPPDRLVGDYRRRMAARWAAYQKAWEKKGAYYEKLYRKAMKEAEEEAKKAKKGDGFHLPIPKLHFPHISLPHPRLPIPKIMRRAARRLIRAVAHIPATAKKAIEAAKEEIEHGLGAARKFVGDYGAWADRQFKRLVVQHKLDIASVVGSAAALVLPTALMKKIGGKKTSNWAVALDMVSVIPVAKVAKIAKVGEEAAKAAELAGKAAKEAEEASKATEIAEKAVKAVEEAKKALKITKPLRKAGLTARIEAHFRSTRLAGRRAAAAAVAVAGAAGAAAVAHAAGTQGRPPDRLVGDYRRRMAARWAAYQKAWEKKGAYYEKLYRKAMKEAEEEAKKAKKKASNVQRKMSEEELRKRLARKYARELIEQARRGCGLAKWVLTHKGAKKFGEEMADRIIHYMHNREELRRLLKEIDDWIKKRKGTLLARYAAEKAAELRRQLSYADRNMTNISDFEVQEAKKLLAMLKSGREPAWLRPYYAHMPRRPRPVPRRPVPTRAVARRASKPASTHSGLRQAPRPVPRRPEPLAVEALPFLRLGLFVALALGLMVLARR